MKKCKGMICAAVIVVMAAYPLLAQNGLDDVKLFQSYFFDAPIAKSMYGQGGLTYSTYEYASILNIGVRGGYPINEKIEVGADLGFISFSPDQGDGQSGLADLGVFGRYNLFQKNTMNVSVGPMVTLPIGSEDVGAGNLNFGAYGAGRYALESGMVLTATLGLFFYEYTEYGEGELVYDPVLEQYVYEPGEESTSYENYIYLGVGTIYPLNQQTNIVGELVMQTEWDYMMLSGGVDYLLGGGRLRAMLGIGLDDGAPDFQIIGGYAITL